MRLLKLFVTLTVLVAALAYGAYAYWQSRLDAPVTVEESTLYEVPRGASYQRIMADLAERGIIRE
ncbi:BCR, YceG family protein, partial [Halomonas sp. BBD48]|nr:BCR, YceG family protein [Halomonas sp. BBD48]